MFNNDNNQDKIVDENILYSVIEKAKKYDQLIKPFTNKRLQCSFCGKSQDQVIRLIAGPMVYICDECVGLCHEILLDESSKTK